MVSTTQLISVWSNELLEGVTVESRITFEELSPSDFQLNVCFKYSYSIREGFPDTCIATNVNTDYCPLDYPFWCKIFTTSESNSTPCCNEAFHPTCRYTLVQTTTSANSTLPAATVPETTYIGVIITFAVIMAISLIVVAIVYQRKKKRAAFRECLRLNYGPSPHSPSERTYVSMTSLLRSEALYQPRPPDNELEISTRL